MTAKEMIQAEIDILSKRGQELLDLYVTLDDDTDDKKTVKILLNVYIDAVHKLYTDLNKTKKRGK